MRLLLDTQIFLWGLANSPRLHAGVQTSIETAEEVYVSAVSIWEACIKIGVGKLDASPEALVRSIAVSGFVALPLLATHAARVAKLPSLHRDPFDRLLIVQALEASLQLLTGDPQLAAYSDLITVVGG